MAGFRQHLLSTYGLAFAIVFVLAGYGIATNDGYVGMILGGAVGLVVDPITVAIGLIIGFVCGLWWQSLAASMIVGVAMRFAIAAIEPELPAAPAYVALAQVLALFVWAGVATALRRLKERQRLNSEGNFDGTQDEAI